MGNGMTENTAGCTWLGGMERGPSEGCREHVVAVVRLWSCKSLGGGSLLAVVVASGGGIPRHGHDQDLSGNHLHGSAPTTSISGNVVLFASYSY